MIRLSLCLSLTLLLTGCGPLAILGAAAGGAFDGGSSSGGGGAPPSGGNGPPPSSGGGGSPPGSGNGASLAAPLTSASLLSPNTVNVTWSPVSGASSYEITRSDTGAQTTVAGTSLTLVLPLETSYVFSVRAVDNLGAKSAFAQTQTITTGPPAPGSPTLSSTSAGAQLTWQDLATKETGYRVRRRFGSNPLATIADLPSGSTNYSDPTALPGRTYEYQLVTLSAVSTSSLPTNAGQTTPPFGGSPTVSSVSSSVLLANGGQLITIQGTNFGHGMSVSLGSQAATDVVPNSASSLSFRTPAYSGTSTTLLNLQATNPQGSGVLNNAVEFLEGYVNESFSGPSFDSQLVDSAAEFVLGAGAIQRAPAGPTPGVPSFLRSVDANFLVRDFRFEVSVTMPSVTSTVYVGLGEGSPDAAISNGPKNSVAWRIQWNAGTGNGTLSLISTEPGGVIYQSVIGTIGPGTHRFRVQSDGTTISFDRHLNYAGGPFVGLGAGVLGLTRAAPGVSPNEARLFVATTASGHDIDDLEIRDLVQPKLRVLRANPAGGSQLGGQAVTVVGRGFSAPGPIQVEFDGTPASAIVVLDDRRLTCQTPPHAAGAVQVAVTNSLGTRSVGGFEYLGPVFTERFGDLARPLHFTFSNADFVMSADDLLAPAHANVGLALSVDPDYATRPFTFEADFGWGSPSGVPFIYVGVGSGAGPPGAPTNAAYLRMRFTFPGTVDLVVDGGPGSVSGIGNLPFGGIHRVRIARSAAGVMTFSVDVNRVAGSFTADFSRQLATTPAFLGAGSSRLFLGVSGDVAYFDDVTVTSP